MSEKEEETWEEILKRKKREEERLLARINEILPYMHSPESERPLTRQQRMKILEKQINKQLDEESWKNVCRVCKSSVCRCPKEEEEE